MSDTTTIEIAEGTTSPLLLTLTADGAAFKGTSTTVGLIVRDRRGHLVTLAGTVSWSDAANGIAAIAAAPSDFPPAHGPYSLRFSVDAGGQRQYFPHDSHRVQLVVVPV